MQDTDFQVQASFQFYDQPGLDLPLGSSFVVPVIASSWFAGGVQRSRQVMGT